MARAKYIYLVRRKSDSGLVGLFTVKHEAHTWVERSKWAVNEVALSRMPDGNCEQPIKTETPIPWDEERSSPARNLAEKLSEQFIHNKQFTGQQ